MKSWHKDLALLLSLLLLFAIVTGLALARQGSPDAIYPPMASFSTQPDGTRALWRWVQALGYNPSDAVTSSFDVPEEADLALILEPQIPITADAEWQPLDAWVEAGGTLLIAGSRYGTVLTMRHYDVNLAPDSTNSEVVQVNTPLLASPAHDIFRHARPRAILETGRHDVTPILTVDGQPVALAFGQGEGQVILTTLDYPLSNAGLKRAGNPQLALNLISFAGESGTIWFDEWHHGRQGTVRGPEQWLRETPAGRSLLYAAITIFIALVLQGQRFGRPLPLPEDKQRRAPVEHLAAIANLNRRAGHRQAILQQYRQELKRKLGQRYRLPAALPDAEFVARLKSYAPDLDEAALLDLLARLNASKVSEAETLTLARRVTEWLHK